MLISASFFVLLNIHRRHRPLNGLAEVVLSLLATTLSLLEPVPEKQHARSRSGRVILECWFLACFSLTVYTKSLLTASLMARPTWEADDTLDKMLPKLQRGYLLPCVENNSFVDVLLARANGSGSDVIGNMALAVKRWARKKDDFTGSVAASLLRTMRGTHVLLEDSLPPCVHLRSEKAIAAGEKPVFSLIGGFPIRKDYPLRSELLSLVHRILETGSVSISVMSAMCGESNLRIDTTSTEHSSSAFTAHSSAKRTTEPISLPADGNAAPAAPKRLRSTQGLPPRPLDMPPVSPTTSWYKIVIKPRARYRHVHSAQPYHSSGSGCRP
ncbi:hypothetical protein HPB49_026692 [Dermacentor silvarum]|nr:hypothetical protein HPB49_026692 [Dermacentor silvarum]